MSSVSDTSNLAAEAYTNRRSFVRYLRDGPPARIQVIPGRDAGRAPEVTIIIPTADGSRAGNLEYLLTQIKQQAFQQLEVIIVQGDRRQGRAINAAAAIARGEILLIMDDDTKLGRNDLIGKVVTALTSDSTIGIAGVSNLVPPSGPWLVRRAMRELPRRSSRLVSQITDSDMAEHPFLAIRKDLFRLIGGEHELIPRGLDPYLRREVRKAGYRVVVLPNAWIHHHLPQTLSGILRQYFRNGIGAAYVKKFYPEFVILQALDHGQETPPDNGHATRILRYVGRMGLAFFMLRWIYLATLVSYALGYAWGERFLKEDSL